MNAVDRIAALLKTTMGMDMSSVGSMRIERAIEERAGILGIADIDVYVLALQTTPDEMQELIETVIVPETWFFRDREAILAVARLAREHILEHTTHTVRILSLPCSTGEEPYSIAMALFDAGIAPARFKIDAIDICHRSLATAQRAQYGRNSFRGKELGYRDRYLTQTGDDYTVSDAVRQQVHFRYGNMFAADFLRHEPHYDYIFCRNVLIYFDRPMQQQAVQVLERLLSPQGTIFVGPAEAGIMLRPHFASAGIPLAFAFHRKPAQETGMAAKKKIPAPLKEFVLPVVTPKKVIVRSIPPLVNDLPNADTLLQRAMAYANQGELDQASALCQQYQHLAGPNAAVLYLMGLIADARNDTPGALQLYRKAVYMQSDHIEALTHIAALLAAQGDATGAQLMQQRAQRAKEQLHA